MEFSEKINSIPSSGIISVGISTGQRCGLFQILTKQDEPISAEELAKLSDCKERYIEKWSLLMVAAEILTMTDNGLYFLPPDRRPAFTALTSAAVHLAPYMSLLARDCMSVADNFKKSTEIIQSYSEPDELYIEWTKNRETVFQIYMDECISKIPNLREKLELGAEALDVGTADGRLVQMLASKFEKSTFIGIDINKSAIEAIQPRVSNALFQTEDATNLPSEWTSKFDYITVVDAFQHFPNIGKASKEFHRILKPGGCLSVVEIKREDDVAKDVKLPNAAVNYLFELYWCDGNDQGHEHSDCATRSSEKLKVPLKEAGFVSVEVHPLPRVDMDDTIHICCQK